MLSGQFGDKEIKLFKDGLYRVSSPYFVAGFVIKDGKIIKCAPILKKKIDYWISQAEWICT